MTCSDGGFGVPQPLQGGHVVQKLVDGELVEQPEVLGQIAQLGFQLPLGLGQGRPSTRMEPEVGSRAATSSFIRVDLPAPLGPSRPIRLGDVQVQVQIPAAPASRWGRSC